MRTVSFSSKSHGSNQYAFKTMPWYFEILKFIMGKIIDFFATSIVAVRRNVCVKLVAVLYDFILSSRLVVVLHVCEASFF